MGVDPLIFKRLNLPSPKTEGFFMTQILKLALKFILIFEPMFKKIIIILFMITTLILLLGCSASVAYLTIVSTRNINLSEKIPSAACKTAKSNTISVMVSWSNKRSGFGTGLLEQASKQIAHKPTTNFFIYTVLSNNKRWPAFFSLILPLA